MIFMIEVLPTEKSMIAYQGSSFFDTFVKFFAAINKWAVLRVDADEGGLATDRYEGQAAIV